MFQFIYPKYGDMILFFIINISVIILFLDIYIKMLLFFIF